MGYLWLIQQQTGRQPMRLKLCIAATIFAAAPIVAFAQDDSSNAEASKPKQMEKAEKTNDTKGLDDLGTRSLIASNSELCPTTFGS
jgi:hypothetical protein